MMAHLMNTNTFDNMQQVNCTIPPDDVRFLDGQAKRHGTNRSDIIRRAIIVYRKQVQRKAQRKRG